MVTNRKLSPTDIRPLFEGKDRRRNTRYYHTMATNPDTPPENMEMVDQFRLDHPEMFLTNEEIEADPTVFQSRRRGRGHRNGYRTSANGEDYDPSGNMVRGWNDGGTPYMYRDPYRSSGYHMTRAELDSRRGGSGAYRRRPRNPRDPSAVMSDEELKATMNGIRTPYRRTKYADRVIMNTDSNPENVDKVIAFKDANPGMFLTEEQMKEVESKPRIPFRSPYKGGYRGNGYGGQYNGRPGPSPRDYDQKSWNENWQTREQYDAMPQGKRSLFSKFIRSRDRNRNSKLALKILSDPQSTQENIQYTQEIVREHPNIFWRPKR